MAPLRPISFVLLGVLACTPAPVPPVPPGAPSLEGDGALVYDFRWTLKGSAAPDTIVRLYVDDACRGPALRDFTSAELVEGVALQLVSGTPNVFSAMSIDSTGLSSACSAPVRVTYEKPERPRIQEVNLTPQTPTRETHFVLRGTVVNAVSVHIFEGFSCTGTPLAELSPEAFGAVGFPLDVMPNIARTFVVQGRNVLGETSSCSHTLTAMSDQFPPVVRPSLLSPTPSPEQSALVAVSLDAARGTAFLGLDCGGPVIGTCLGYDCNAVRVAFPMAASSSWSVSAIDGVGNASTCVNAPDSWEWDPLAPPPVIELITNQQQLRGRVPASSVFVEVFDGPACDPDHLRARMSGTQLAGVGYYTTQFNVPSDGGVLTARGLDTNMTPNSACSQPVPWY